MLLVWNICDRVGYDRRYLAPASLALLPLACGVVRDELRQNSRGRRLAAILFLLGYVTLPVTYGYVTFAAKIVAASGYRVAPSGLWNPLLADRQGASVDSDLNSRLTDPAHDVWYLPEPILALDLRGRKIFGHPTWAPGPPDETLYRTSRPLRILALAPRSADATAAAYLAQIFPQGTGWKREPVPQANYVLWSTELRP